jgi:hypothetical protein
VRQPLRLRPTTFGWGPFVSTQPPPLVLVLRPYPLAEKTLGETEGNLTDTAANWHTYTVRYIALYQPNRCSPISSRRSTGNRTPSLSSSTTKPSAPFRSRPRWTPLELRTTHLRLRASNYLSGPRASTHLRRALSTGRAGLLTGTTRTT